jgi:predicted transcriptional regulator with HTH domain
MIWYGKVVIKSREGFKYFVTQSVYKLKHLTRSSKVFRVISFGL